VLKILNFRTDNTISMGFCETTRKLLTRLEVFDMLRRYLGNFKKTHSSIVVDESTTLCTRSEGK
jgi:hypothetical protein